MRTRHAITIRELENLTKPELRKSFRDSDISCQTVNCCYRHTFIPSCPRPHWMTVFISLTSFILPPLLHNVYFICSILDIIKTLLIYWNTSSTIAPVFLRSYWSPATRASSCGQQALAMVSKLSQTQSGRSWTECEQLMLCCVSANHHTNILTNDQSRVVIVFCWHDYQRTPCDHLSPLARVPGAGDNGSVLQDTVTILSSRKVINNDLVLS